MRLNNILFIVGLLCLFLAGAMVAPLATALLYDDGSAPAFIRSILATVVCGGVLAFAMRPKERISLSHRDGMAVVVFAWLAAGFFGALPFWWHGVFSSLTDAVFEAISGFTTTGASVMTNIEIVPKGVLLWRSLTHWLGGMGIIVLAVAILPFLGVGGMEIYRAEVPSPVVDRLRPRITETARTLWKVYVLISAAEALLLFLGGMDWFDAVCHTFGTLATGGFSTKNASMAAYGAYHQYVVTLFMFLAGVNFSLHYKALRGKPLIFWRDPEFRLYTLLTVIFTVMVVVSLCYNNVFNSLEECFRHGLFQVLTILTTTGYATADFEKWPIMIQSILLFCMFLGASAGSTGGGVKVLRVMLLTKHGIRELKRLIHPRAVYAIKLGGVAVPDAVLNSVWGFFGLYLLLFVIAWWFMAALGLDLITSFSSVAATIGNIGPGLGMVGPTDNYAAIPLAGKWMLILCMLAGRLEIYTLIILLVPEFWRK